MLAHAAFSLLQGLWTDTVQWLLSVWSFVYSLCIFVGHLFVLCVPSTSQKHASWWNCSS